MACDGTAPGFDSIVRRWLTSASAERALNSSAWKAPQNEKPSHGKMRHVCGDAAGGESCGDGDCNGRGRTRGRGKGGVKRRMRAPFWGEPQRPGPVRPKMRYAP